VNLKENFEGINSSFEIYKVYQTELIYNFHSSFFLSLMNFAKFLTDKLIIYLSNLGEKMSKNKKVVRKKNIIQDYFEAILFAFVVAMVIRNYTFQNFKIPSSSMESTLLVGDYLAANKMVYFFKDPKREDIVTFRYPDDPVNPNKVKWYSPYYAYAGHYKKIFPPIYFNTKKFFDPKALTFCHLTYYAKKNVVKRVIGMPGDTIKVVNKKVFINGKEYDRDFAQHIDYRTIPRSKGQIYWGNKFMGSRDNFGPVVVPQGEYFVMGDNRDNSADSRFWGFLKRNEITGSPAIIFFSKDENTGKIRWNRLFKIIK